MSKIPQNDSEFDNYATGAVAYINANLVHFGLAAPDIADLLAAKSQWDATLAQHIAIQNEAKAATAAKIDARRNRVTGLERRLRAIRRRIDGIPATTNGDRATLGIAIAGQPASTPGSIESASRPVVMVDTGARLLHRLRWTDEATGKRAKPAGIRQIEIRLAVTMHTEPVPPVERFEFFTIQSASKCRKEFDSADAGKVANYIARWIHRSGSHGSWSEIARATIVG